MLIGFKLGRSIVKRLPRDHASGRQFLRTIKSQLVIRQRGSGFVEIVLGLLHFFRA